MRETAEALTPSLLKVLVLWNGTSCQPGVPSFSWSSKQLDFVYYDAAEVGMTESGASPSLWLLRIFRCRPQWLEAPSQDWRLPRGYHHNHSCEQNGWTMGLGVIYGNMLEGRAETLRGRCGGNRPPEHISVVSIQMLFVSYIWTY
jgi:hypothetical protein